MNGNDAKLQTVEEAFHGLLEIDLRWATQARGDYPSIYNNSYWNDELV